MKRVKEAAYIKEIRLESIRSFKDFHIRLDSPDGLRMMSLIVGRNGTCKSTFLRSIAMGLGHTADSSALLSESTGRLVADDVSEANVTYIIASAKGDKIGEIRLTIKSENGRDILVQHAVEIEKDFYLFVCGYGPTRGNTGTPSHQGYRVKDSTATLFDYRRNLVDIELTLRRLEDYMGTARYKKAQKGIKRVLGLDENHSIQYARGGGVTISGPGVGENIPLEAWADGYRMTFNWLIDLYGWAMHADAITETGSVRGILLIDEIDQNLHPALQSRLLPQLRDVLPEMQIFATTHSPLTALGTDAENVIALHRKEHSVQAVPVPSLSGFSTDDALMEESLFGTDPYPDHTRQKRTRIRRLSVIPKGKRSRKEEAEFKKLTSELNPRDLPSLRDDPVLKKLDRIASLLEKDNPS